jgi:hypothetical protein
VLQLVVEKHETLRRLAFLDSAGVELERVVHSVPFQCAAAAAVSLASPTAAHDVEDAQDTEFITDSGVAVVDWIAQLVPFQRSAKKLPLPAEPTASQNEELVQETPSNTETDPPGPGTVCIDHADPFHDSAIGTILPSVPSPPPTEIQLDSDTHDTEVKLLMGPPGLGVDKIDHSVPFHRSENVKTFPLK